MLNVLTKRKYQPISARVLLYVSSSAIVAISSIVYVFRKDILNAYSAVEHSILSSVGFGVIVISFWVGVFLWSMLKNRSLFSRYNWWIGSLFAMAFVVGLLAWFNPYDGWFAYFTSNGDNSLGGSVGDSILEQRGPYGALRLFAILFMAVTIIVPRHTRHGAIWLGKTIVFMYVLSFTGLKVVVSAFGRNIIRLGAKDKLPSISTSADVEDEEALDNTQLDAQTVSDSSMSITFPIEDKNSLKSPLFESVSGSTVNEGGVEEDNQVISGPIQNYEEDGLGLEQEQIKWTEPSPRSFFKNGSDIVEVPAPNPKSNKFWDSSDSTEATSDRSNINEDGFLPRESTTKTTDEIYGSWEKPPSDLLVQTVEGGISQDQIDETAQKIKNTLADYGVEVELGRVRPGPTVTMYGLVPGWVRRQKRVRVLDENGDVKKDAAGKIVYTNKETKVRVKVDSITSREKDLALAMKTPSLRIETPAMGEALVGIEVPNPSANVVSLGGVMESDEFEGLSDHAKLPIALGKGSGGETVVLDLAQMPHLLVAGATGSGKSVCLNTIVSCLLMGKSPEEMRLLLVDPKRVELTPYNGIPHLLTPVVVETDQVVALLKGMIREMLNRYRRFEEVGARNIDGFNDKMAEKIPYLVVVIDELADLMMSASFDVEQSLCRLAQLGRATGIHLVVATQRPSVDVVTGLIKANFPSRVSFGVTSQIDSRTILDTAGAEKLLGKGDMLYLPSDGARPERVQGVFISDMEIDSLVRWWHGTSWGFLPEVSLRVVSGEEDRNGESEDDSLLDDRDSMLESAIELAQRHSKMSTSLLQRRLRIGYPRAARIMDELEDRGIVGPSDGSKSREVIASTD